MEFDFTNKYIAGIIAVIVGILACTVGMIPAISDATSVTYTNNNPSWVKLSEYDDYDDIPWDTLTVTFSDRTMTVDQDGHSVSGYIFDMILFAGKGEGCADSVYIEDGKICIMNVYPFNSTTVYSVKSYDTATMTFTKGSDYISVSGTGQFIIPIFRDSRSGSFSHTFTDFVVPDYEGDVASFDYRGLYTDMDESYAMSFFAGITSLNEYSTYDMYSSTYYVDGQNVVNYQATPIDIEYVATMGDERFERAQWTVNGNSSSGSPASNPSSPSMPDPVIPDVPISYVTPDYTDGNWGFNILNASQRTAALVSYSGTGGAIEIPLTLNLSGLDYDVVQLGAGEGHPLFTNASLSSNTTITFDEDSHARGISVISASAFQDCTNLTGDITLSWSSTGAVSIGDYAFMGSGFRYIDVGVTTDLSLGDYCYARCPNLLCIANTGQKTSEGCCMNDTALISYDISSVSPSDIVPSAVVTYNTSDYAFYGCSALTILAPSGTVGKMAFKNCTSAQSVSLDATTSISYGAFEGCRDVALESFNEGKFTIGASFIDSKAFASFGADNDLGVLILSNSLTAICDDSFGGSGFSIVKIPDSCTVIGDRAFNSSNLSVLNLGNGVTSIGVNAFGSSALSGTLVIPESVAEIKSVAFSYTGIENVIDKSNATIDSDAFLGTSVSEVMSENNRTYSCFHSADVSNTYDADLYLASLSISTTLKGPLYGIMIALPIVFLAGMIGFTWWVVSKRSE